MQTYAFVWALYICIGKCLEFQRTYSEAAGTIMLKFHVESPWDGGRGPLTKMSVMSIYVFRIPQNQVSILALSLHKIIGDGRFNEVAKMMFLI